MGGDEVKMPFCWQVREEIEFDNLAKQYLREMIKRECWDEMQVKGRALQVRFKCFLSELFSVQASDIAIDPLAFFF